MNHIMDKNNNSRHQDFSIYHDLMIDAPISKVFKAVSKPEHLINWWPLKCKGIPQVGAEYNFFFGNKYNWYAQVIAFKPNESFHIQMTKSDADWNDTKIGFDLEEVNDKVQLKFWHIAWPECNEHYRRSSFCWAMLLNDLKNYLERGLVIPFDQRE